MNPHQLHILILLIRTMAATITSAIINTIESTKDLIREIFAVAQMIRALHDDLYEDTRDVDILYGLLLNKFV